MRLNPIIFLFICIVDRGETIKFVDNIGGLVLDVLGNRVCMLQARISIAKSRIVEELRLVTAGLIVVV